MAKDFDSNETESGKCASIGASISIKGEITGAEDLLIEGTVDGTVNVREHAVIVGGSAKVNANIYANVIRVEGTVNGDLFGREQIVIQKTGCVRGNISAPRLSLEDGARLKGAIDTEPNVNEVFNVEKVKAAPTLSPDAAARAKEMSKANGLASRSTQAQ